MCGVFKFNPNDNYIMVLHKDQTGPFRLHNFLIPVKQGQYSSNLGPTYTVNYYITFK